MRNIFIYLLVLLSASKAFSQQEIQSSQFMINPFLLNPAYSSMDDDLDFKLSSRKQWVGVEGAPTTNYMSIDTPLGKPRWAATHPGDFHNWHGAGFQLINDAIGPYSNTRVNLSYSYNLKLHNGANYGYQHKDGLRMSLGVQAGFNNFSIDGERLGSSKTNTGGLIENQSVGGDNTYNQLFYAGSQRTTDMNFGALVYYNQKYYLGFSTTQILEQNIRISDDTRLARHYFVLGQIKHQLTESSYLIPSFIAKFTPSAPISYEANVRYDYIDKYFFGAGYRRGDAISLMIGSELKWGEKIKNFRLDKHRYKVQFYYTYDYTVSKLNSKYLLGRSKGSHEIMIAFLIPPFFHERNAEDTW